MKTMILITLMGSLIICLSCCSILFPDEKLSLERTDYHGNELRTDGYYYYQEENYTHTLVVFLYKNGTILSARSYSSHDLNDVEKEMVNSYDKIGKEKTYWGVFTINGNQIKYERWVAPTESISISKSIGYIENDTTFCITEEFFSYNRKTYHTNEVWHFKHFTNKPDSINSYIK
jgi:hypothetical protein